MNGKVIQKFSAFLRVQKFQAIFASPNRYFTENSLWVPLTCLDQTSTLYVPKFCPSQSEYYFLGRYVMYWNIKYQQTDNFSPLTRRSTLLVSLNSEFSTFDPKRRNPITKVREAFHYMMYTTQNGLSDRFDRHNSKEERRHWYDMRVTLIYQFLQMQRISYLSDLQP